MQRDFIATLCLRHSGASRGPRDMLVFAHGTSEPSPSASTWIGLSSRHTSTSRLHGFSPWERRGTMATLLAFHEVDDVEHWLSSPKREEVFGPLGIMVRTFRDPEGSNRVGLIADVPDMAAFEGLMQSEAGAEAMQFDGVRPETMLILTEG